MNEKLEKQKASGILKMVLGIIFAMGFADFAGIVASDTSMTTSKSLFLAQYLPAFLLALAFVSGFISLIGMWTMSLSAKGILLDKFDN